MPKRPRVSIGLPVFNGELYVEEALNSLLSQSFSDYELIISDNASTDSTPDICERYAARDPRIRFYRNDQNRGLAWNCNRVFQLSTGEYFKWAHHDDLCKPDFILRCVDVLDAKPSVVLCYSDVILIDEHGKELKHYEDSGRVISSLPHERFRNLLETVGLSNHMFGLIRSSALR